MTDPDPQETGFYWISINDQDPEVAQWQREWEQWFVIGRELPLSDERALNVTVLSSALELPVLPPEPE